MVTSGNLTDFIFVVVLRIIAAVVGHLGPELVFSHCIYVGRGNVSDIAFWEVRGELTISLQSLVPEAPGWGAALL